MSKQKYFPTKEELVDLYYNQNMTIKEISKQLKMCGKTVKKYFNNYGIELKPYVASEETKLKISKKSLQKELPTKTELDEIYQKHIVENKSVYFITKHYYNHLSGTNVTNLLKQNGYKLLKLSGGKQIDKATLEKMYIIDKKSMNVITKECNTSYDQLYKLFDLYGIEQRSMSDAIKIVSESNGSKEWFQTDEFKSRAYQTKLEKYGTPYPHLNNFTSKPELDIQEFLNQFGYDFKKHYIGKNEIDLYCDELKLGIEYCGLYWHNELSPSPKKMKYHYDKMKLCNEQGIRLITIFEDEWVERKEQVKGFLQSIVDKKIETIRGSKCVVKEIDKHTALESCQKWHIQGYKGNNIVRAVGLYHKDETVAVMVFSGHHRQNGQQGIVLSRMCFKHGLRIHGGAMKMLKFSVENFFQNETIISWSDNRWSEGNVYAKMGFEKECELKADYSYVKLKKCNERHAKQNFTKKKLGIQKSSQTELEKATELGFARIWDCGKIRWVFKNNV